jgi:hypothetical protein
VKAEQELDVFCRKVKEGLSQRQDYMVNEDGLLYRKDPERTPRIVIPETLVDRLIRDHHDAKQAAHVGVKRTQQWTRKNIIGPTYTGTSKIKS